MISDFLLNICGHFLAKMRSADGATSEAVLGIYIVISFRSGAYLLLFDLVGELCGYILRSP